MPPFRRGRSDRLRGNFCAAFEAVIFSREKTQARTSVGGMGRRCGRWSSVVQTGERAVAATAEEPNHSLLPKLDGESGGTMKSPKEM